MSKFKLLSDERFVEVSSKVSNSTEYSQCRDRAIELQKQLKAMLSLEGRELLSELEEVCSASEGMAVEKYYEQGFRDALSIR
jgi:hypothetical protein